MKAMTSIQMGDKKVSPECALAFLKKRNTI